MPPGYDEFTYRIAFALFQLVIIAMLLERGLAFIFDWRVWRDRFDKKGLKAPVSFAAALSVCWFHDFDLLSRVFESEGETLLGIIYTALIVAGGSAGAIKLFQDVLGFGRTAREAAAEIREKEKEARLAQLAAGAPPRGQ